MQSRTMASMQQDYLSRLEYNQSGLGLCLLTVSHELILQTGLHGSVKRVQICIYLQVPDPDLKISIHSNC